jgi:GT2 family glycosyltransferase
MRRVALVQEAGDLAQAAAARVKGGLSAARLEVASVTLAELANDPAEAVVSIALPLPDTVLAERPCVLVVPKGALQVETGSLALACSLFPFGAVAAESEDDARSLARLRVARVGLLGPASERDAALWPVLFAHAAPAPLTKEEEGPAVAVQGTDVTRRLRLATRALARPALARPHPQTPAPLISIVMLSWDQPQFTESCIASVRRHTPQAHEIVLVDNGSQPDTKARVRALPDVFLENVKNEGFARANNQGFARSRGEIIVFLNNDTEVNEGWLDGPLDLVRDPEVGIVAPAVSAAGGWVSVRQQPTGVVREVLPFTESPPAVCYVARREVVERVHGFSEEYPLGSGEDVDLCFRVWWEGWRILVDERNVIHHEHGGTTRAKLEDRAEVWDRNRTQFLETWLARGREHEQRVREDLAAADRAPRTEAMSKGESDSFTSIETKEWKLPRDLLYERRLYARYIAELSLQIQALERKREADMKNIARERARFEQKLADLEVARRGPPPGTWENEEATLTERWRRRQRRLEIQLLIARLAAVVALAAAGALFAARASPALSNRWLWGGAALVILTGGVLALAAWRRRMRRLAS